MMSVVPHPPRHYPPLIPLPPATPDVLHTPDRELLRARLRQRCAVIGQATVDAYAAKIAAAAAANDDAWWHENLWVDDLAALCETVCEDGGSGGSTPEGSSPGGSSPGGSTPVTHVLSVPGSPTAFPQWPFAPAVSPVTPTPSEPMPASIEDIPELWLNKPDPMALILASPLVATLFEKDIEAALRTYCVVLDVDLAACLANDAYYTLLRAAVARECVIAWIAVLNRFVGADVVACEGAPAVPIADTDAHAAVVALLAQWPAPGLFDNEEFAWAVWQIARAWAALVPMSL